MCTIQVKNYHLFYTTVLEYNRSLWLETRQGQGTGLYCYDAFLQKNVTWYTRIAWLLEDVRGMPNPTGSKQAPALIGACALCGIYVEHDYQVEKTTQRPKVQHFTLGLYAIAMMKH